MLLDLSNETIKELFYLGRIKCLNEKHKDCHVSMIDVLKYGIVKFECLDHDVVFYSKIVGG